MDEVEHGLEPHRLLHLLQSLREAVAAAEGTPGLGQVILTTHSADAVAELNMDEIHIVRSADGLTTIQRVPDAFDDADGIDPQALTRAGAAALLARRVIVAEGRTEVGYVRAMASLWKNARGTPVAHRGTTTMDGGGHQAVGRAVGFVRLGYETALFVDSDVSIEVTTAFEAGVRVIQWADSVSTEERITRDLPEEDLERLVRLAIELVEDQDAVLSAIGSQLPVRIDPLETPDVLSWVSSTAPIDAVREAIGKAAKKKKWFKGIEQGQRLGNLVGKLLPQMGVATRWRRRPILRTSRTESENYPPHAVRRRLSKSDCGFRCSAPRLRIQCRSGAPGREGGQDRTDRAGHSLRERNSWPPTHPDPYPRWGSCSQGSIGAPWCSAAVLHIDYHRRVGTQVGPCTTPR